MAKDAYLVIDIGTGNVRVAVVQPDGTVIGVARDDIHYHRDDLYPDSIYFDPPELWAQIIRLGKEALQQAASVHIKALITTSQREGIVLIDEKGQSLIGLPNIDHRGREWEGRIKDKSKVYRLTGRYPTSLFSALKLVGIRERREDIWKKTSTFLSISDWAAFQLSGASSYEHSQASETILYDVAKKEWSTELCNLFGIPAHLLPPLADSGTVIDQVQRNVAEQWNISAGAAVVVGGGDTQLAVKGAQPSVDDIVIVSGTTTPIVKVVDKYVLDDRERTWTSRDIVNGRFMFEANAGVTGLNYQRLKEVFYPNEGYEVIEKELAANGKTHCFASLGSLIASETVPVTRGGFHFPTPVTHELTRSCFVRATLMDISFSIAENYKVLREVSGHAKDAVWACGGGMQSRTLRQLLANVLQKKVEVRFGYEQSSAVGGALICNEALGAKEIRMNKSVETIHPSPESFEGLYKEWKRTRSLFMKGAEA